MAQDSDDPIDKAKTHNSVYQSSGQTDPEERNEEIIKAQHAWIAATTDMLQALDAPNAAAVVQGPHESVSLCLFATLVPSGHFKHYMDEITDKMNELIQSYPEVRKTTPQDLH